MDMRRSLILDEVVGPGLITVNTFDMVCVRIIRATAMGKDGEESPFDDDDDDVYYYARWRLKLEGETENMQNMGVCTQ